MLDGFIYVINVVMKLDCVWSKIVVENGKKDETILNVRCNRVYVVFETISIPMTSWDVETLCQRVLFTL